MSTVFTAMRYSHVDSAESPRNVASLRKTCRNASCVRSSASAVLFVMRRHTEYTLALCAWNKDANASASPIWARFTRSRSDSNRAMVAVSVVTGALLSKRLSFLGSEQSGLAVITVMKVEFFVQMVYPVRSVSVNRRSCTALTHKKFRVRDEIVQNWGGGGTFF